MNLVLRNRCAVVAMLGTTSMLGIHTTAFSPTVGVSPRSPSTEATPFPGPPSYRPSPSPAGYRQPQHPPVSSSALNLFSSFFDPREGDETPRKILTTAVFGFLVAAYLAFDDNGLFYVVDAGEIGISSTLGIIEKQDPGLHTKIPFLTSVRNLSTKTQLLEQSNFVPTKEGLTVELDTAVLVKLDPEKALDLYRSVGPDFVSKVVTPEASSSVRGLTSESEAKALYTSGRSELQNRLRDELRDKLGERGVIVEDVLLKNVVLPEALSKSIEEKARAEQESARMEFVLLKETQEAKRKAIEAEGIADFQKIVSDGITPSMLQWKGIEATQKLASSPNAKVVIVGNSKDSLPVILGNDK